MDVESSTDIWKKRSAKDKEKKGVDTKKKMSTGGMQKFTHREQKRERQRKP